MRVCFCWAVSAHRTLSSYTCKDWWSVSMHLKWKLIGLNLVLCKLSQFLLANACHYSYFWNPMKKNLKNIWDTNNHHFDQKVIVVTASLKFDSVAGNFNGSESWTPHSSFKGILQLRIIVKLVQWLVNDIVVLLFILGKLRNCLEDISKAAFQVPCYTANCILSNCLLQWTVVPAHMSHTSYQPCKEGKIIIN